LKLCVDKCAATAGCVGVSHGTGSGQCYLKGVLRQAVYSGSINGEFCHPRSMECT
jgi:hypothetical protein